MGQPEHDPREPRSRSPKIQNSNLKYALLLEIFYSLLPVCSSGAPLKSPERGKISSNFVDRFFLEEGGGWGEGAGLQFSSEGVHIKTLRAPSERRMISRNA